MKLSEKVAALAWGFRSKTQRAGVQSLADDVWFLEQCLDDRAKLVAACQVALQELRAYGESGVVITQLNEALGIRQSADAEVRS